MSLSKTIWILILSAAFNGCTKQVPGPKGEPGKDGEMGNLKATHVIKQAATWTTGSNGWECTLTVPEITANVISKGEVVSYMQINDQWWKLPHTVGNLFTQAAIDVGKVKLKYYMIHDGPPEQPGSITFKFMISEPVQ